MKYGEILIEVSFVVGRKRILSYAHFSGGAFVEDTILFWETALSWNELSDFLYTENKFAFVVTVSTIV